ncbi:MAG: hypothetical protein ABIR32_11585 [Ilumatobacteraceae bacterium]
MNGRTCANCGWDDATVVEEIWGLPAPQDPVESLPPAPPTAPQVAPPTVIAAPAPLPLHQPVQQTSYQSPVPPPPPRTQYPAFSRGPVPSPAKSHTGVIIGGLVAVVILAVGAFFVFGRSGDDSTATDNTRTERTERTERTDDPNDTAETTAQTTATTATATSSVLDPITTGAPDPTRDYPQDVRTNFLDACEVNSPTSTCVCILEGLETIYSIDEFAALEQQYKTTNQFTDAFNNVVASCK